MAFGNSVIMAWNRTKRVVQFCPLISETSAATKEKIYKEQRKLQDIIRKLDYQRQNVERQFDMEKRSIRDELRTRVGTRTVRLDAVDLPKLRTLGLENAPKEVILSLLDAFPDLFHAEPDVHLPSLSREGTRSSGFDEMSDESSVVRRLMALVLPSREKPLTPAQSVDRLILEKNIKFMRTTIECKEKYNKEHMIFDPTLSFRQREYLRRQRSARRSARCGRSARVRSGKANRGSDDATCSTDRITVEEVRLVDDAEKLDGETEEYNEDGDHADEIGPPGHALKELTQNLDREITNVSLPEEVLLTAAENSPDPKEQGTEKTGPADVDNGKPAISARRQGLTPDGRKRDEVLKAVGELLQRSHTFPDSSGRLCSNQRGLNGDISQSPPSPPTNARLDKSISIRIRQKYLHEPRRQMFIRNVTQEKESANRRRLERRSHGTPRALAPGRTTAPTLFGWHAIMQNSAHIAQKRSAFRQDRETGRSSTSRRQTVR